jgi:uncharacterized protein YjiS (DUF1127 family)
MSTTLYHKPELKCTCQEQNKQRTLSADLRRGLDTLAATVRRWHSRSRQRQALAELSSHLLNDIGVSRLEADREAEKPFWS